MYTIEELNVRLLSELKEIAEGMGIKNFKKLPKKELIYKILDFQASNPESVSKVKTEAEPKQKPKSKPSPEIKEEKPRRKIAKRQNVRDLPEKKDSDKTADELLESLSFDFDESITSFSSDTPEEKPREKVVPEKSPRRESPKERPERFERNDHREQKAKRTNIKDFDGLIENEGVLSLSP